MSDASRQPRSGSEKRKRHRLVGVRVDDNEYHEIQAALAVWKGSVEAQRYGDGIGGMIRYMTIGGGARKLRKAAQKKFELPAEIDLAVLLSRHNRIGNNLNQIARAYHRGRDPLPEWLEGAIKEHRETCDMIAKVLGIYV